MAFFSKIKTNLSMALLAAFACVQAIAVPTVVKRQSVTVLSASQIVAFLPYTHYASTAYCSPASTLAWNCGPNCQANPSFIPVTSGGDGDTIQFWFVGFDPTLEEVIVAHQGTNTNNIIPVIEDLDVTMEHLDSGLFPGISGSVKAHSGFTDEQARSASDVFTAVQTALSRFGAAKVTVTGHSLGSAIALLDALSLHLRIPQVNVRYVGYAAPRVGNKAFASFIDSTPMSVTHINNKEDPVPILPQEFFGYRHPSGEIHIQDNGAWVACPGQDNSNSQCVVGDVRNIFEGNIDDHMGPFDGIVMGC